MSRLQKKLSLWQEKSFISAEQKQQILDFEEANKKPALLIGLSLVGVFVILLGLISIIAANWEYIPASVKLISDFALFACIIFASYKAYEKGKKKICEALLFAVFMMTGATIGLVAQVYQLSGNFSAACLSWSVLTLPLILLTKVRLLSFIWIPMFFLSAYDSLRFLQKIMDKIIDFISSICAWQAMLAALGIVFCSLFAALFEYLNKKCKKDIVLFGVLYIYSVISMYICAFSGLTITFDSHLFSFIPALIINLGFLGYMTYISYVTGKNRRLNTNLIFIAVTFFIVYLRWADDLLSTGIGLVISGILIIGIVYLLHRIISAANRSITAKEEVKNEQ